MDSKINTNINIEKKNNMFDSWQYIGYLEDIASYVLEYPSVEYEFGFCSSFYKKNPLSIHPVWVEYSPKDKILKLISKEKVLIGFSVNRHIQTEQSQSCLSVNNSNQEGCFKHVMFLPYRNNDYQRSHSNSSEKEHLWTNYYFNESTNTFIWSGTKNNNHVKLYVRKST